MDLQGYSSTPSNSSRSIVCNTSHLHRPSPPSSDSALTSPLSILAIHQSSPFDSWSPMASDFRGLSMGRPASGAPLNPVGWPIVVPTATNMAQSGVPEAPWRRHAASYETTVSRIAAQASDAPFALPFEVNDNYLPSYAQMPANQYRQHVRPRYVQQLQQQEKDELEMQQAAKQWLDELVNSEEGEKQAEAIRADDPMRPLSRWQRQCLISQDYLTRSPESDEESELMALMSQESIPDDEKPTDETFCRELAHPLWSRSGQIDHAKNSHGGKRRDTRRARDAATAQQLHFQECHPIEMTPESIDDYLYKSMNGGMNAQARKQ